MLSSKAVIQRIAVRTGYPVTASWAVRNHGTMGTVAGVVRHHTGTGINYARLDDYPTLRVVREGRSDLPGPLCTWGIGRSGRIYLVNDQVAWHAGNGWWQGVTDANGHMWGIEAESDGTYWTAAETDAYHRLVASALYELGRGWEWAPRHAQWALPHGRKTDSAGMDEALFERRVRAMLANPASINRNAGGTTAPTQEEDVPLTAADGQTVWNTRVEVPKAQAKAFAQPAYSAEQMLFGANYWAGQAAKGVAAMQAALVTVTRLLADGNTVQPDELEAALNKAIAPVLAALNTDTTPGA